MQFLPQIQNSTLTPWMSKEDLEDERFIANQKKQLGFLKGLAFAILPAEERQQKANLQNEAQHQYTFYGGNEAIESCASLISDGSEETPSPRLGDINLISNS